MEGMIILSQKEAHKAGVMREVVAGNLRLKDVAVVMKVSERQALFWLSSGSRCTLRLG